MATTFKLVHISDLHFSEGTSSQASHTHSIPHLRGLQASLRNQVADRFLITGDISNYGDSESLLRGRDWLFGTLSIGRGEAIGLKLKPDSTCVLPGNHDAWNNDRTSAIRKRWQRSLENFHDAFPERAAAIAENGAYYDWISRGDSGIFLAFLDSSFLGDPVLEKQIARPALFERVAKGSISLSQSQKLLEWFDRGMEGQLPDPYHPGAMIPDQDFSKALKILVMHHYLFEPAGSDNDYFMQVTDRDQCFRNIALADFDVLLCGHKHIADFHPYTYGEHFDARARMRYLLNVFRRAIKIRSLPVQYVDKKGLRLSKWVSTAINLFVAMGKRDETPEFFVQEVCDLLDRALQDPDAVQGEVRRFLAKRGARAEEVISRRELDELRQQIARHVRLEHRRALRPILRQIREFVRALEARPFIQIVAGSAAKNPRSPEARRSFNVYEIINNDSGWTLYSERYSWDPSTEEFLGTPARHQHEFTETRTPKFRLAGGQDT